MTIILSRIKSKFIESYRDQWWMHRVAETYDTLFSIETFFNQQIQDSKHKIEMLHNKYKGERCFILGNGPSLNKTDLTLLKNEYTFGLNKIYLLFDKLGYQTTFLVCTNPLVAQQSGGIFDSLKIQKFISLKSRKYISYDENTILIKTLAKTGFRKTPTKGLWEGATVTFIAMQLAYYLGFKEVYLVGVDHSYISTHKPHTAAMFKGDDPNHFHPDYFKNQIWHSPSLKTSEYAYALARTEFENSGRVIMDATVGGHLEVFEKVSYTSLF